MPKLVQLKDKDGNIYIKPFNNVMTANLGANLSGINVNQYSPKLNQSVSTGTKLILANNGIRIGKGVSRVKVSANTFIDVNGSGYLWFFIRKNSSNVASHIQQGTNNFVSCAMPEKLITVAENDIITLIYDVTFPYPYTIRGDINTWLTVEVVE